MLTNLSAHTTNDNFLLQDYQQNNNQQSLATLYLQYSHLVYGVCNKYLQNAEKSKDATMEIYEEVVAKLKTHKVENFKSWLYVVAKNYCLMQLRKQKGKTTVEFAATEFMQFENFEHLDSVLQKEKSLTQLEKCIEELNKEQKQIIELFYLQQKCYKQIVEETKLDWNKVRSTVQNGRRNLKICMEKNEQ